MRNMALPNSPAFSYPLPVLVRVLFNLLIFKGKILYYNKYIGRYNTCRHFCVYCYANTSRECVQKNAVHYSDDSESLIRS